MNYSPSLKKLQLAFDRRMVRLERIIITNNPGSETFGRNLAYVTIESLNAWSVFCRNLYLSCAWLQAKTINGSLAKPSVISFTAERDAILHAISVLKPGPIYARALASSAISSRDEPTWHEISTLIRLTSNLSLTNSAQINAGLSYPTDFFKQGPIIRNFFAHRNSETAHKVRRMSSSPPYSFAISHPHNFLTQLMPGRPQDIVSEWLEDLRLISHEMCL